MNSDNYKIGGYYDLKLIILIITVIIVISGFLLYRYWILIGGEP